MDGGQGDTPGRHANRMRESSTTDRVLASAVHASFPNLKSWPRGRCLYAFVMVNARIHLAASFDGGA